jgi:hypothetical protein
MADWTKQVARAAAAAYDFSRFRTIVDVGGGNGTLLAGILAATPGPRGIVFDVPHVATRAQAQLAERGVADRCTAVGGDFFQEVPRGGDAYVLKHVIHDWNDERAVTAANDVNMLVSTGGRQRSDPELRALYEAAGFTLTRLVPTPPLQTRVIEGAPA